MKQQATGIPRSSAAALRPLPWRPNRRTVVTDVLLGAGLSLPLSVPSQGLLGGSTQGSAWEVVGWFLLMGVVVAASRAYPMVSLFLAMATSPFHPGFTVAMIVMSYLSGRRMARALPVVLGFAASLALTAAALVTLDADVISGMDVAAEMLGIALYVVFASVFPWLAGRYWRQYQGLVHAGWERAEQLEREQRILADQARLRERSRIAGDMHDSLGHELSLIALRAGALEMAPDLDEHHRNAAGELRSAAATATERLREIIGVLRDAPAPMEPPGEGIPELVERARSSGMAVELVREGEPTDLAPLVDRAAHRVAQEALTNAAKHAPGAAVTVRLDHSAAETGVTVTNEPPADGPPPEPAQGNRGLVGLRERVRLAGGTLHAGTRDGGGFEVVARLPHAAPAPDAAASGDAAVPGDAASDAGTGRSESARHLEHVRRRARRGLVTAVVVPVGLSACLGAVALSYYIFVAYNSVLEPAEFERLRVGQDRAEVERVLPASEMLDPPTRPAPPGSTCRYYESQASPFARFEVYRLCFADGRLVSKEALPYTDSPDSSETSHVE